ncbi:tRNA (5-methylaminomethyl-2-thiouridine)(34)-methyltransferase MnmD [uncultured Sunxiuqinia sp.]|uniref:tRNA (5-methylaminomethyl-2-thiouridine)(34)-methyltransferase MnmD n=1 Tax=uncultured Sunxiuqinia sp. TaxID=1573825 RepID=UPI002632B880|nr:tRNA (5-methylaminomethyl-2-thiouridine)(34)-methyltransferase MnmD [uncultured Sunxiuqinia sp.]
MKRFLKLTEDGSHTLYLPEMDEHFHSIHGAIQESMHVFIANGLNRCTKTEINILEIGFGTGLNTLLSLLNRQEKTIHYYSLEKYPLTEAEYSQLNYAQNYDTETQSLFLNLHHSEWGKPVQIAPGFELTKLQADLCSVDLAQFPFFDLVYFDAFAPDKQPELWTDAIFSKISAQCQPGAILTTYCAKGVIRRSLQQNGFLMHRLPGPPGKRQMLMGEKA